jgi:hypothetical protein
MSVEEPEEDALLNDADECLVESLLRQTLRPDPAERERRIEGVMAAIEPADVARETSVYRRWGRGNWVRYTVAAGLVIALGVWWQDSSPGQRAYATVQRSLEAAASAGARRYAVVSEVRRPFQGNITVRGDLYVDGAKRFAVRHPARLPLRDVWIGGNEREHWIVPPVGPVMIGDEQMLRSWMSRRDDADTPFLHVTTLLERLATHYDLEMLPGESIADQAGGVVDIECQRVRGRLRADGDSRGPQQVDLWASRVTGDARRVVLDWELTPEQFGRSLMTIELVEHPQLPADWFEPSAHTVGVAQEAP